MDRGREGGRGKIEEGERGRDREREREGGGGREGGEERREKESKNGTLLKFQHHL